MRFIFLIWVASLLAGCASTELKAPCDYQGHFCGQKMKINH
jgi:hypothetical protein